MPDRATLPAPATRSLDAQLAHELAALDAAGLRRRLRPLTRVGGAELQTVDGTTLVDFASNDYLGLAADPRPAAAAAELLAHEGLGAGAARLISGDHPAHHALEAALAALKGTARALLFPSGWAANAGALPALAGREDAIYADALNHASLIDGSRLSRATVRVFPHGDLHALDAMLREDAGRFRRRWLVVEGVYSMDGDLCALDRLVAIARAHDAFTYVDDAHATGVLGPDGRGSAAHWGVTDAIDVTVGTLGKSLGTSGAFVAGSAAVCDLLLHRARSFVFTTGTPPALAAATLRALAVAHDEPWRRARVRVIAARLRAGLAAMGRPAPGEPDGHVVPVPIGDPRATVALGEALRVRGFLVGAIRPPTVPPGSSRLRVSASAAHTDAQVDGLLAALRDTLTDPLVFRA
ncbi:MAG: aminotransferase class I/II-fold pyridoxal phosphate-dependent enzyme [Gemmatirosa sp.]